MENITKIHNEVYDLLMNYRQKDPSCYFTFRKSNRANRLEEGYWFYGNENSLAVSFWSGMDWKNKTPNIIFVILPDSGETFLEVSTTDSDEKRAFASQYLVGPLEMVARGQRYRKLYSQSGNDYMASLAEFLDSDKILIDRIILDNNTFFARTVNESIGFLSEAEFESQLEKINAYRAKQNINFAAEQLDKVVDKPQSLASVRIENFGPIKEVEIPEIPYATQWIFFTGENGTGKTSILRAIATALCFRNTTIEETTLGHPFRVNLSLHLSTETRIDFERIENQRIETKETLTSGFAAYGQSRLRTENLASSSDKGEPFPYTPLYDSLFSIESYLVDLQRQFDRWQENVAFSSAYEKRKSYITEILTDILPNLYNIVFNDRSGDIPVTWYIERDNEGGEFKKIRFDQLASGLKSMIAMIGDIMVRLYEQQPTVSDPAEFTGVILIDEIDIHLHPKLQKQLVEQLTRTFPRLQFIATTHSPISLLGAPQGSLIYKVERNALEGVTIQRLDDKLILGDLLPNTILTSPIFGLEDIIPNSHEVKNIVRTETKYADVKFNDEVKRKIHEFITDEKEQQLIDLFKSRRT